MWFDNKTSSELLLATNRIEHYFHSFRNIETCIEDFARYKTIDYQLGIAILNQLIDHMIRSVYTYFDEGKPGFSKIILIEYCKDGMFDNEYYPAKLIIETDRGNFTLDYDSYSTPDGNTIKLKTPITIGSEKEIMIYSVANWIKQLMK